MPKPVTVRLRALDGVWEVPGLDRSLGVWIEDLVTEGDPWGPSKATFTLQRYPIFVWPDLRAFNQIEIETDTLCFAGDVSGTPAHSGDDQKISVQARGRQFHLDDDQLERGYVHDRLTDWKDARSSLSATLTALTSAVQVQAGEGMISIVWPQGVVATGRGAVVFDAGPGQTIARVVVPWSITAGAANRAFVIGSADTNDGGTLTDSTTVYNAVGASSGTATWTLPTPRRFVFLCHDANAHTPTADEALKITQALLVSSTAYESGNASNLKAPVLFNDVLDRATVFISSDRSQIDPGNTVTTNIPMTWPTTPQTPREYLEQGNAFHDYKLQVDVLSRLVFGPKPSAPIFQVDEASDLEGDPDDGDGEEVYNRVITVAQTRDGQPLRAARIAAQQTGAKLARITSPGPTNPSFDVDASGWSVSGGTIVRSTTAGEFDSSPGGGKWSPGSAGLQLIGSFTGTFKAGVTYLLTFRIKISAASSPTLIQFGASGDAVTFDGSTITSGSFQTVTMTWTPSADRTGVTLLMISRNGNDVFVDTLTLDRAVPTIVDRQNFRRTKRLEVSMALPSDAVVANKLADLSLADHKTIPFKGPFGVREGGVRNVLTGETVPLEVLPCKTMELLRFMDRADPDTGGWGRDGRIVNAKWIWAEDRAELTIDNTRQSLPTLLTRLGVATGS